MPYDPALAERLEALYPDLERKKMFGGVCYLLQGNMCLGVYKEFLIVRVGQDQARTIQGEPGVGPMDITGRPMKGWAMVSPGFGLERYCQMALDFASTLPPK